MADWMIWLAMAGIVVILEMFSGTFYLLMIAFGLAAGALAALVGLAPSVQLIVAAVVGIVATYALRRSRWGRRRAIDAVRDPNINLDIGQSVQVEHWDANGSTRAMYRGAPWDIELAAGEEARPGSFIIREVRGSRLIVSGQHANDN